MRYSLQNKILIPFSIVIFLGLASLLFVSYNINNRSTLKIIEGDMIGIRKNLDLYLRQYFLLNNLEMNKLSIESEAEKISRELGPQIGASVEIYGFDASAEEPLAHMPVAANEDFIRAKGGETAYSIMHVGDKVLVSLSYPLEINSSMIGIIRSTKDYTEQYEYNRSFKNIINIFAIIIFILIFITAYLLSRQLTKPINQLIKGSDQISDGDFELSFNINSQDEIGQLAQRFGIMAKRIKEQIEIIKRDRDALKELQFQSKTFFDNVTHELKTPLTTIMGYAQVMRDNGFTDKVFFDKGTSYIINESERLNQLVAEILEISKSSTLAFNYTFEIVDLKEIIEATCEEMKIKARRYNIDICHSLRGDLIMRGDKNKLKELLINLLDNSIKYGDVNSDIEVAAYREKTEIIMIVKDKGEGIADENIPKVFEPFYRVPGINKKEKGSAGLGLAIVMDIVERHDASIAVKSKQGEGTEVKVIFQGEEYA